LRMVLDPTSVTDLTSTCVGSDVVIMPFGSKAPPQVADTRNIMMCANM
jgi:hypothetical protein